MTDTEVWKPFGSDDDVEFSGLVDGLPLWLAQSFWDFLTPAFTKRSANGRAWDTFDTALLRKVERQLRVSVPYTGSSIFDGMASLRSAFTKSKTQLRLADFLLANREIAPDSLDKILLEGGSKWTVGKRAGKAGLVSRVPEGAQEAAEAVMSSAGHAGARLAEAWNAAFGIDPNPSHAYSLAVKAVEDAAIPVALPKNPAATLGTVLTHMKDTDWALPFTREHKDYPVSATLIGQMQMLWTGQTDRHGGNDGPSVAVSQQAAEAAVMFAVPIVWAFTSGAATKK